MRRSRCEERLAGRDESPSTTGKRLSGAASPTPHCVGRLLRGRSPREKPPHQGRWPRSRPEGFSPLTVGIAKLRAGHARPLRTAVNRCAREGQGRAAARPYGWRKVRGQGCRGRRPRRPAEGSRPLPTMQTVKGDTTARLRAGHARPLRTAVSGSGGSGERPNLRWRKARRR